MTSARDSLPPGAERRQHERVDVHLEVDYASDENFLFSYITNISEMGIFIRTEDPLPVGTHVRLRFAPSGDEPLALRGIVTWINPVRLDGDNPNPGIGIKLLDLSDQEREQIVSSVRTIAYLHEAPCDD